MKKERVFDRAALREIDRRAVEEFHIPILVLMENAGRAAAEEALRMLGKELGKVLVVAGPGNNGGDGLVAARWLHNAGAAVTVLLLAEREKYKEAAGVQLSIIQTMKLEIEVVTTGHAELRDWLVDSGPDDLIVDAIFGTGLSRRVEGLAAEVIAAINGSHRRVLAVDLPSGMNPDTGEPLGVAVKATETVSFCGGKTGFKNARALTGRVVIADIGAPRQLLEDLAVR